MVYMHENNLKEKIDQTKQDRTTVNGYKNWPCPLLLKIIKKKKKKHFLIQYMFHIMPI